MRFSVFLCVGLSAAALAARAEVFPKFKAVTIDDKIEIGYGLAIADVDGDKKPDVLLADKKQIVWYHNPDWAKHVIAENLTELDNVCIAAEDIDGDGKAEVAVGAGWNPGDTVNSGAVFYLKAPEDRTQKWEPIKLHHEPTVHRMKWVKNDAGAFDLVVVPLHGRGNKGGAGEGVQILSYSRPADPHQPWKTNLVDGTLHMTHNFHPHQWDSDPGTELLVAAKEGVFMIDRIKGEWKRRQFSDPGDTNIVGVGEIRYGRLPGHLRMLATIEPMHGNQLVYYKSGNVGQPWERTVIADNLLEGHALACADFMSADFSQVVVGWRGRKPGDKVGIRIYVPAATADAKWESVLLDDNGMACEDIATADLNGDGRIDIIASGRSTKNVKIYFNEGL